MRNRQSLIADLLGFTSFFFFYFCFIFAAFFLYDFIWFDCTKSDNNYIYFRYFGLSRQTNLLLLQKFLFRVAVCSAFWFEIDKASVQFVNVLEMFVMFSSGKK